ncbi:hypothetical protein MRS44_011154 [Fusarium solani]|uniref:uncharacterized protein n=1 Tax=Fusarium solani TaxID=169388 RepID=UPI0032C47211|nr:hypothetical protein MRS44_011154 [Fusarium solani]
MDDATRSTFPQEASMKTSQLHFGPESGQERHLFCPHLYTMRRHLGWRLDMDEGEERFENMEYKEFQLGNGEMGTCVREEILAEKGILGRMHPTIQSLRLITDPECPRGACEPMRLPNFRQLKSLSWKGPNAAYLLELGHLIIKSSQHLQEVEIDLLDWERVEEINGYYDDSDSEGWATGSADSWMDSSRNGDKKAGFFACIWKWHLRTTTPRPIFNALTKLPLSHVRVGPGLIDEMNIGLLRSLTLRSCPKWTSFLEYAPKVNVALKLKELEIEDHGDWPNPPRLSTLWGFLDSFSGLQKLYLSFEELIGILPPCGHISRHRDTLQRLAQYDGVIDNTLVWNSEDSQEESDRDGDGKAPTQDPSSNLHLECLGPTADSSAGDMPQGAAQSAQRLRLLEPFTSLTKWAFGSEGPPSLKFITCGDFAHYGHTDKECFILRRGLEGDDEFQFIVPGSIKPHFRRPSLKMNIQVLNCIVYREITLRQIDISRLFQFDD